MTAQVRKQPAAQPNIKSTLKNVNAIIAVSSCKGGVGKSTIAACLAQELAQRGFKVGLADLDLHGPSIPALFNLSGKAVQVTKDQHLVPHEINGLKVISFGFLLGDAPAVMRGPLVSRYVQQLLHSTEWGELDYLFIDMPPGTGDVQLTVTQSVRLNGAVIVTTRQTLSLLDVQRGILMFEKVDVPILGVIENMAYFVCDKCDKKHYIFGGSTGGTLEQRFGLETLAEVPLLPEFTRHLPEHLDNQFIKSAVDKVVMAVGKAGIAEKNIPETRFDQKNIYFKWNDAPEITIPNRALRLDCRCAMCVDELSGKTLLQSENIREDIAPKEITPLGNYAIGITWNDGHSSGIYPYKLIKKLTGKVGSMQ
jgi:ATP-binding protein involved in chromosome partitioning